MTSFVPVRLKTLKPDFDLGFNLYVKLPSKYLLYVSEQYSLTTEQFERLLAKKVRKLFISPEEEQNYQEFLDGYLQKSLENNDSSNESANILFDMGLDDIEKNYQLIKENKQIDSSNDFITRFSSILGDRTDVFQHLMHIEDNSESSSVISRLQICALKASAFICAFSTKEGFDAKIVDSLTQAAFFHLVGAYNLEVSVLEVFLKQDKTTVSPDELMKFRTYPEKSCQLLKNQEGINNTIIDYVFKHCEKLDGTGFPNKMTKLTNELQCLGLVCLIVHKVYLQDQDLQSVLDNLILEEVGKYDLEYIKKISAFIKESNLLD